MTVVDDRTAVPAAPVEHRIVPALIGTYRRHQVVYIPCPYWCTEDHMDSPYALEDICHYADMSGVQVSSFLDESTALYNWWVRVESDPASGDPRMRAAHVLMGDDSAEEARLTPEMAEALSDDLISFAAQIRMAALTARQANRVAVA
ncbi:DUF6907 domain-containing protein [Streptomyces enissocaesilis]|uniref:Uncharacterized protein n=1 Tax=Streptomyces enissocaesilis TaxID=332589 RepID=A0ABP6JEY8_9ACTN